jgi:hypothetical protein
MFPHVLPVFVTLLTVSAPLAAFAATLELPARKPGLWEMSMSFEGRQMPPMSSQHCIDDETDKLMQATGGQMSKDMCQKQDVQKIGDTLTIDSVCKIGDSTNTSHAVLTGDFNSAYTMKVESKREGGSAMMAPAGAGGVTHMVIEAKWVGACKPDQKPGDIMMGNGMKMNIKDMQNIPGMMKRP